MTDDRYRIAMAHQACEVADLAGQAVSVTDPDRALAQALEVVKAAHTLLDAALAYSRHPHRSFALDHPAEAAEDIADWLATWSGCRGPSTGHAHGGGRGPSPSTHS